MQSENNYKDLVKVLPVHKSTACRIVSEVMHIYHDINEHFIITACHKEGKVMSGNHRQKKELKHEFDLKELFKVLPAVRRANYCACIIIWLK